MADDPTPAKGDAPDPASEAEPKGDAVIQQAENPDAVKRALEAERSAAREAKKRADAAEAKVREYEEANASELEKLQKKATQAEQAKADAEAKLLRYEVAQAKDVPAKLVPLLTASTKEELEAQADLILENAKPAQPDFDGGPRDPAPDPKTPEEQHNDLALGLLGLKH